MFQEIDFMTPMRVFLMSYPALNPKEKIEVLDYMKFETASPREPGNAVTLVGTNRPGRKYDILGNVILTEQANFIFYIRRYTNDNELRQSIGNFMLNFIRWINYENEMRGTPNENPLLPHFSQTANELIIASGGTEIGMTEDPNVSEFQLQIQLEYQTIYEGID